MAQRVESDYALAMQREATLEEAIEGLRAMGDIVIVFGMRPRVADTLQKTGVMRLLGPRQVASNRLEALRAAETYTAEAAALPTSAVK